MKSIVLQKMKTVLNSQFSKRIFTICVCFVLFGIASAFAQNNVDGSAGISALATVESQIGAYVPYVRSLIYVIAGIVAVIGSINVYMKMNNGEQDVSKSIMMLVGACLFLVAAATALPKFFGLP